MTDPNVCPMCGQHEPPRDPNRPKDLEIWVLTRSHNLYDQQGEYFVRAWVGRPTKQQISEALPAKVWYDEGLVHYIHLGGGRRNDDEVWYNLEKQE